MQVNKKGVKVNNKNLSWLTDTPIAHRGLWGKEIVENSLTAYQKAIDNGYPIEIDLFLTADGHLVSFHDDNLKRMTGFDGLIYNQTISTIKSLRLNKTQQYIPTFEEVLQLVNGKVPLLIELKDQPSKDYIQKVLERLKEYNGEFAIQSFNPLYIKKVKKLAPNFAIGILGTDDKNIDRNFIIRYVVKNMPFNKSINPDFISYRQTGLPLPFKKTKNRIVLAWTITDELQYKAVYKHCNNIIFEGFIPKKLNK